MKKHINLGISEELYKRLKQKSEQESETITHIINKLIKDYISLEKIPTSQSYPLTQLPTYSNTISENNPIEKKEEPTGLFSFADKILDMWDNNQDMCIYIHEEFNEIKEYLSNLETNDEAYRIYTEARRIAKAQGDEGRAYTIPNFVEWAKQLLANNE